MKSRVQTYLSFILLFALAAGIDAGAQGKWDAWKYRMPVKLTHRDPETAKLVPVDVTFSLFADRCRRPEREIRLVLKTGNTEKEVPFQLSRVSAWTNDVDGEKSRPTVNGMITFFDEAPGSADAEYAILYGNTNAEPPSYPTDLEVSGTGPAWTIANSAMTVTLHSSGQLSSVTLRDNPSAPVAPETGIIHWNPGVFIPNRYWAHSFAWDPPEYCEVTGEGPVFVEITRSGVFPDIPEIHLSITYRIFTGRRYVESGTVMRVRDDVGVVALRNDELVFDEGFFTHVGWDNNGETVVKPMNAYSPVNRHGDILRLPADTPFVTLFNPSTGIGAATIRVDYANVGPKGGPPRLFDNATYVSNGHLQYWFRPLIYFHIDWDRKQLITVPEGSIYSERNLYYFYKADGSGTIDNVVSLARAVENRPGIEIGPYGLPPGE